MYIPLAVYKFEVDSIYCNFPFVYKMVTVTTEERNSVTDWGEIKFSLYFSVLPKYWPCDYLPYSKHMIYFFINLLLKIIKKNAEDDELKF